MFWQARSRISDLRFLGHRSAFNFRQGLRERRAESNTFWSLGKSTLKQLALATTLALVLQFLNPFVDDFVEISNLVVPSDSYSTFLATVVAAGGVLIGLYYAAITTIAGAIYSRVPNNIRDLLAEDRAGNVYIRFLAFLTFLGVVLLAFRAGGLPPVRVALIFLSIGSGISIIGFVRLGARAFNLFDPTNLSGQSIETLENAFFSVTPGHYRWNDSAFQNYAMKTAKRSVETIRTLGKLAAKESQLNGAGLLTVSGQLIRMLINYGIIKKSIPTGSLWYPVKYTHPDWYRSDDSSTSLAHQTSSRLEPTKISERDWLESSILPVVYDCVSVNHDEGRNENILTVISYLDSYASALCNEHEVDLAIRMLNELVDRCSNIVFRAKKDEEIREPLEQVALCEAIAALLINILLAYCAAAKRFDRNEYDNALSKISWLDPSSIYESGLPLYCLPKLEWAQPRISFELESEHARITPQWYLEELVRQAAIEKSKSSITSLSKTAKSIFEKWDALAEKNELLWVRANLVTRESEYWRKLNYHLSTLQDRWNNLSADKRIEGLPWDEVNFEELRTLASERKKILDGLMSKLAKQLSVTDRPSEYPDFAGQFLHNAGESLLEALLENDAASFNAIFPNYFDASLMQYGKLGTNIGAMDWRGEIALKVAVAPVLDLMQLSGYAILLAEFNNNPKLSDVVFKRWKLYLDGKKAEGAEILRFLSAALGLTESAFELAHRSIIRTNWGLLVFRKIGELPTENVGHGFSSHCEVVHTSPLVRLFGGSHSMPSLYDGIDVFIERIVKPRPDSDEFETSARRRDLGEALERRNRRNRPSAPESEGEPDED